MIGLDVDRVAFSAIPWFNRKQDPADPESADLWLLDTPEFAGEYPEVLAQIRATGFAAVPLEVLPSQSTADFVALVDRVGLRIAPGYVAVSLPDADSAGWREANRTAIEHFAAASREAGIDTAFLAPALDWGESAIRARIAAVGHAFSRDRLERMCEVLAEAAETLRQAGIHAGLHNHVGTWIETEDEIEYVLQQLPPELLGASFDVGHLAWAGIDPAAFIGRHRDRLIDLHVKDLDLELAAAARAARTPYYWAPSRGLFREPGYGGIDLGAVVGALPDDFGGWMVIEVDRTSRLPRESAERSHQWVERMRAP